MSYNGPVFPTPEARFPDGTLMSSAEPGMSLRDWFAGQAMKALLSRNFSYANWNPLVEDSYAIADAMLAQRNKPTQS